MLLFVYNLHVSCWNSWTALMTFCKAISVALMVDRSTHCGAWCSGFESYYKLELLFLLLCVAVFVLKTFICLVLKCDHFFCDLFHLEHKTYCNMYDHSRYQDIGLASFKYSEPDSFGSSTVPGHLRINIFVFPECQSTPIY